MGYAHRGDPRARGHGPTSPRRCTCSADEAEWVKRATGVSDSDLVAARQRRHGDGRRRSRSRCMHTPGHTPGSQCFLVDGRLVAGDTLFLDGCGRTDLPGGDPEAMYESLTQRLAIVPDDTVLYPGHLYSPEPSAPMGDDASAQLRVPHRAASTSGACHGRHERRAVDGASAPRRSHRLATSGLPLVMRAAGATCAAR